MKYFRTTFIGLALAASLGLGAAYGVNQRADEPQDKSSCQICGDGFCARQCGENERTCPRDCAPQPD